MSIFHVKQLLTLHEQLVRLSQLYPYTTINCVIQKAITDAE